MPAEVARLHHRVGGRDRRFFAALAALAVLATFAGILVAGHDAPTLGCISFAQAGVMGGGNRHLCGDQAVAYCRTRPSATGCVFLRRQ